jgi:site-specific recombinase XerC
VKEQPVNSPINPQTAVATLVDFWLEQLRAERRLDGTTINEYERILRILVIPSVGAVRISEITTGRIDEVLVELGAQSLNRQRKAKVVMGAILDTAVELGALTVNPVRGSLTCVFHAKGRDTVSRNAKAPVL